MMHPDEKQSQERNNKRQRQEYQCFCLFRHFSLDGPVKSQTRNEQYKDGKELGDRKEVDNDVVYGLWRDVIQTARHAGPRVRKRQPDKR